MASGGSGPVGPGISGTYSTGGSGSSAPRALVTVAGQQFTPIAYGITKNAHGVLDTADVTLPISAYRDLSTLFQTTQNNGSVLAQIYGGFPPANASGPVTTAQLTRRFFGLLDSLEPEFEKDEVKLTFRSLGALLELTKQTHPSSQTTTSLVTACANAVGLTPKIQLLSGQVPATLGLVYGRDFAVGLQNQRLWDTLVHCAEVDDVDVWVDDSFLYYQNAGSVKRTTIALDYGNDLISFSGKHSAQFNKNIKVEVVTWSPKIRHSSTVSYTYAGDGSPPVKKEVEKVATSESLFNQNGSVTDGSSYNPTTGAYSQTQTTSTTQGGRFSTGFTSIPSATSAERYVLRIPNLYGPNGESLADQRCLTYYNQLSRHEYTATFRLAPTPKNYGSITIESLFTTKNVPYQAWNTNKTYPYFYPRRITESFDGPGEGGSGGGLTIEVEAVNHVPPTGEV